ncbi:large ribosomal RNA subunit accumulation protein YCED homolog 2, chloroplastic isoform X2 [Abrus precatorius]|uniref:Large ribosomal RNA subunit accumulation protein YCED homolog 2, chloroplastic isoform X2 n=1 Tax=Abrus precatorius TaxID=3816 RepID=A0A8B8LNQ0_ABRPR|nr:large ribosomal RNA subunit accumulation protein YCED homolog 2, chloroplastic isoform X2 [Abrus precatorius]
MAANAGNLVSPRSFNPIFNPCHVAAKFKTFRLLSRFHSHNNLSVTASKRKDNLHSPVIGKNTTRAARRLITISPGDGKYHGDWTCDFLVSLHDLHLQDLIEVEDDPHKNAQVFVNLSIQKHASFGLSVDGRVTTSFPRKCSNCSAPYCRQIDTKFNVWVLMASRDDRKVSLPEIGGDPYVIYVRPGYEVDLDSLVQDAIRLNSSVNDTCSELCEKSEATIQCGQSQASVDKRWSKLLELKKANL